MTTGPRAAEIVPVEISSSIVEFEGVEYDHAFIRDISERKAAERALRERDERLLQAQKMESVGRLAGGVAHDYNNMLGVILGHADLALMEIDPSTPLHVDIEEIKKRRAALGGPHPAAADLCPQADRGSTGDRP